MIIKSVILNIFSRVDSPTCLEARKSLSVACFIGDQRFFKKERLFSKNSKETSSIFSMGELIFLGIALTYSAGFNYDKNNFSQSNWINIDSRKLMTALAFSQDS